MPKVKNDLQYIEFIEQFFSKMSALWNINGLQVGFFKNPNKTTLFDVGFFFP